MGKEEGGKGAHTEEDNKNAPYFSKRKIKRGRKEGKKKEKTEKRHGGS